MRLVKNNIKHFLACSILAFNVSLIEAALGASYHTAWIAGFVAGMAIGVGKEYRDKSNNNGKWDWGDLAADCIGSVIGASGGSFFSVL